MAGSKSKGHPCFGAGKGDDRVFADFVKLYSLPLSNAVDRSQFDTREARYHEIRKGYARKEFERFPEDRFAGVLGSLYMELELGNARSGQFFTPYPVFRMMASIAVGDGADVRRRGFLGMAGPASLVDGNPNVACWIELNG